MKHTIFKSTAVSLAAIVLIGAGQSVLGQATVQTITTRGDTREAKVSSHGDKAGRDVAGQTRKGMEKSVALRSDKLDSGAGYGATGSHRHSRNSVTQDGILAQPSFQQTGQSQYRQTQGPAFTVQGNQANHYNGRWSSGDSHANWNQQMDHRWRDHDYRWYDGGWLIIDPGYNVAGSSVGSNVQASLSQQGYYNGPIDGYIGQGTRRAIAHYESDNGLVVNGEIDGPLLASLRLE